MRILSQISNDLTKEGMVGYETGPSERSVPFPEASVTTSAHFISEIKSPVLGRTQTYWTFSHSGEGKKNVDFFFFNFILFQARFEFWGCELNVH